MPITDDELEELLTTPKQRIRQQRNIIIDDMKSRWKKDMTLQEISEYMNLRKEAQRLEDIENNTPSADENPTLLMQIADMMDAMNMIRDNSEGAAYYEKWEQCHRRELPPNPYYTDEENSITKYWTSYRFECAKKAFKFIEKFDSEQAAYEYLKNKMKIEYNGLYTNEFWSKMFTAADNHLD